MFGFLISHLIRCLVLTVVFGLIIAFEFKLSGHTLPPSVVPKGLLMFFGVSFGMGLIVRTVVVGFRTFLVNRKEQSITVSNSDQADAKNLSERQDAYVKFDFSADSNRENCSTALLQEARLQVETSTVRSNGFQPALSNGFQPNFG